MVNFVVGNVLPDVERLRIAWTETDSITYANANPIVTTNSGAYELIGADSGGNFIDDRTIISTAATWLSQCGLTNTENCGIARFLEIDTSTWSLSKRAIDTVSNTTNVGLTYEVITTPVLFDGVRIDNVLYEEILEQSFTLTREEQGNRGFIKLHTTSGERFEPYAPVEIGFNDDVYWFIVEKDMTIKLDENLYEHNVHLKDAIAMFDSIYPPDRKFTRIQEFPITVGQMLVRYSGSGLEATPQKAHFTLDFGDEIYETTMPQKEYVGVNLSTIIKDIMRRIKARPILKNLTSFPFLTYERIAERVGDEPITDFDSWEYLHNEQDTVSYSTSALGKVKNAVLEDGRGMWYPSPTGYVGVRTEEYRLDEPTAAYIVDGRIWGVLQMVIKDAVEYIDNPDGPLKTADLDISDWVVTKDEWNNLDNITTANFYDADPDNKNQANAIYYEIGGNQITKLWDTFPGLLSREHLLGAMLSAVGKFANDNPTYSQVALVDAVETWQDKALAKIRYVSQRDIDYLIEKINVLNKFDSTMLSNQMSSLVELNQHADALSLLAERLGNDKIVFRKSFEANPYELGNFTADDYLVSTIKYDVIGTQIYVEGELSKNYANINAETSVTREPYPYQVTTRNVQTNIITREYIEFSATSKTITGYTNGQVRDTLMNLFSWLEVDNKQIYDAQIVPNIPIYTTGDYVGKAIHAPVITFGGNAIVMHFRFTHPTYAGLTITKDGSERKRGAITYVDEDNFLLSYRVRFGARSTWDESGNSKLYPLVDQVASSSVQPEIKSIGDDLGILIDVGLDPNCTLAHTHELLFVSDSPSVVLNGNLGFFNNLIQPVTSAPNIKVYQSATAVDKFTHSDKVVRATDTHLATATITYVRNTRLLTISNTSALPNNIALVLDDEHILLAYNHTTAPSTSVALYVNNVLERTEKRVFPQ